MAREWTSTSSSAQPSTPHSLPLAKTQTRNSLFLLTIAMNSLSSTRKPLSHFLLSLSSSSSSRPFYITLFSTSSSSSSSSYRRYSSVPRRYDDDSRNVRVSVWWDIENCGVPCGSNVFKISQSIIAAVRANGIKGPVQISAFGDVLCLSRANQEALSITGINLIHIPNGNSFCPQFLRFWSH